MYSVVLQNKPSVIKKVPKGLKYAKMKIFQQPIRFYMKMLRLLESKKHKISII